MPGQQFQETIWVDLAKDEVFDRGKQLAKLAIEYRSVETVKKEKTKEYNDHLKEIRLQMDRLAEIIEMERERRPVDTSDLPT